ncbi:hypothetical protein PICMEDRAFT_18221 [Pichia membranifaciens NRRL Y-2026]|uniref:Uncharacterized protein n=1 Tax=Pichia membranifaciens NRRL Y-2026 TaxID=763406 RepID=A0A1E3NDT3_9ASCO|nr:hypothetical protein PICMEDRAFT_18221 [Pichia membranifaciens NRRL Y-2026]ODQ44291.1 hypothetical protein PICMEDRAFT_18221 [Pichia membranifaciens NRRL Y-2026]
MSDTEVESLNTVSPLTFKEIVANIKDCAAETAQTQDFIGFSTVLDLYLHDWNVYSVEERLALMELLCQILDDDKELLAEVAWDLPPLLLPFLDCEWPVRFALKDTVEVPLVWKAFNLLATYGNPKELLLTCCEQLGQLADPVEDAATIDEAEIIEIETNMDDWYKTQYNDLSYLIQDYVTDWSNRCVIIKFHTLFQCIKFCVQRVKTLYPSKFLSMAVSSILNFFNSAEHISGVISVQRSLYIFLRDYIPPEIPDDTLTSGENTPEELARIFDDECYLQRKLIRLLFDSIVDKMARDHHRVFIAKLLPKLGFPKMASEELFFELINRLLSLSLSLDIDLSGSLAKEIKDAAFLFDGSDNKVESSEDILSLAVSAYNNSSFRSKEPKALPTSTTSLGFLYMYAKYIENWNISIPESIKVLDLIKVQLKMFIPYIVNSKLTDLTSVGYFMVLTIIKIEKSKVIASKEEFEIKKVNLLIRTYLQNISSIICRSDSLIMAKLYSKFMKKFLQHLPEDISYSYILDTLTNCPFDENVLSTLTIFKNLISMSKFDDENLTADLSELSLDGKESSKKSALPPPLPQRSGKGFKTSFINFTKLRQDDFINLVNEWTAATFDSNESNLDVMKSNRLLSYLNFINSVRFEDKRKLLSVLNNIEKLASQVQSKVNGETDNSIPVIIDLIKFAVNKGNKIYGDGLKET